MKYYLNPFLEMFKFNGRSNLKSFWMFFIINLVISVSLALTKKLHGIDEIGNYYRILYIIPFVALGFRRLQDTGRSGWYFLVPIINLYWASIPGDKNENQYGKPVQ